MNTLPYFKMNASIFTMTKNIVYWTARTSRKKFNRCLPFDSIYLNFANNIIQRCSTSPIYCKFFEFQRKQHFIPLSLCDVNLFHASQHAVSIPHSVDIDWIDHKTLIFNCSQMYKTLHFFHNFQCNRSIYADEI